MNRIYRYEAEGLARAAEAMTGGSPSRSQVAPRAALLGFAVFLGIFCREVASNGFATAAANNNPAARSNEMINHRMAGVVSAIALTGAAHAQNAVQWRVADGGNGHWYQRFDVAVNWFDARDACVARGGHLATLTSAAENNFASAIDQGRNSWLGGFQPPKSCEPDCGWEWVTGEPWSFVNWDPPNQPDDSGGIQDYLLFWTGNRWADIEATPPNYPPYLCEWSADCNNDGIVDYGQILDGSLTDGNVNNIPDCCEGGEACVPRFAQWRISDGGNGHWYMLNWEVREWPAAQDRAVQLGGHLATITTNAERLFVLPLCDNHIGADVWLGASRANAASPVQWVTGEPWSYTAWSPGSPNPNSPYDYLEMIGRSNEADFGLWNLELIYAWGPGQISLIEFDADCNSDGIVDFGQIRDGTLADSNHNNIPDCCEGGPPCTPPCPADIVEDHAVNGVDLAAVINAWGTNGGAIPRADTNHDGVVDGVDLANVLGSWGPCP